MAKKKIWEEGVQIKEKPFYFSFINDDFISIENSFKKETITQYSQTMTLDENNGIPRVPTSETGRHA